MNWLRELLVGSGLGHVLFVISFVIALGLWLGRLRIRGVALGTTCVLLVGIATGHFGSQFPSHLYTDAEGAKHFVDPTILHFVKEYGLILFVYAIGMQVGSTFFSAFKKGGVKLNLLALALILLGVGAAMGIHYVAGVSTPVAVGILCGAVTNTPSLGAAQAAYGAFGGDEVILSNAYATAYPLGVLGAIFVFVLLRVVFRLDLSRERELAAPASEPTSGASSPTGDEPHGPTARVNASSVTKVFICMMLGVLVGSIPIPLPGIAQPLKLGLAGGPLVVSILMGAFATKLHLHFILPPNSLLSMREIGICLFLAAVGLGAGPSFYETVKNGGLAWVGYGAIITIVPIALVGVLGLTVFKVDYFTLTGVLSGGTTDPPALSYSNDVAENNRPLVGYATVYPMSMFLRIITAQLLIVFMT